MSNLLEYSGFREDVMNFHVAIIVDNRQEEDRGLLEHVLCLHITVDIIVQNFEHSVKLLGKRAYLVWVVHAVNQDTRSAHDVLLVEGGFCWINAEGEDVAGNVVFLVGLSNLETSYNFWERGRDVFHQHLKFFGA